MAGPDVLTWRPGVCILVRGRSVQQGAGAYACRNARSMGCRNSHAQHALHRHRMAAITPVMEETTGAMPLTVIIVRGVNIVFAPEGSLEMGELDSLRLFRIAFGFGDLANHA